MKPVGQVHVAEAEQKPEPEQGGEQADDCISIRVRDSEAPGGSWEKSAIASQSIMRLVAEPDVTAAQTFLETAKELAWRGTGELTEELSVAAEGSRTNCAGPA